MMVFCGGMIRSGSTWQYQVAAHLLEHQGLGRRWAYSEPAKLEAVLADTPPERLHGVVKSHPVVPSIARLLQERRANALYCYRDLRDVAASAMRVFARGWSHDRILAMLQEAVTHETHWRSHPGTLVQRYEDLTADAAGAVEQIANHLEIPLVCGEARQIAAVYSPDQQVQRIRKWLDSNPNGRFDPDSMLYPNHLAAHNVEDRAPRLSPEWDRKIADRLPNWFMLHGYRIHFV